ncbi:MAG: AAA family ATPase [Candidatus Woesearchaeota archaeon]
MIIAISGIPCSGKTTLAKQLCAQFGWTYLDGKGILKEQEFVYDPVAKTYDVPVRSFVAYVKRRLKQVTYPVVIDSHMSHLLPMVDVVVVCTTTQMVLAQRMKKRRYTKQKIKDNIEAHNFDICRIEAQEMGHKRIISVDTSIGLTQKKIKDVVKKIMQV